MKRRIILALLFVIPSSGHAASLILGSPGGWNGFELSASIRAGFRQAGGTAGVASEIVTSDQGFTYITPFVDEAGDVLAATSTTSGNPGLSASVAPDSGLAKDVAQGSLSASFTVGSATTNDRFDFTIDSLTSAELAQVDFGDGLENADAFFEATITLRTWSPAVIPGAVIQLPDLPTLTAATSSETLTASYTTYHDGVMVSESYGPGESGDVVGLDLSAVHEMFEYKLTYSVVTPFGTDPVTNYSFAGTTAVPEPSTIICLALPVLGFFRRRRV